jgi:hypothetical protein
MKAVQTFIVLLFSTILLLLPLGLLIAASYCTGLCIDTRFPSNVHGPNSVIYIARTGAGYAVLWSFYKLIYWFLSLTQKLFQFITYLAEKFIG